MKVHRLTIISLGAVGLGLLAGCSSAPADATSDSGAQAPDTGTTADAGDGGASDAAADAGDNDAGNPDAGTPDTGGTDAGNPDGGDAGDGGGGPVACPSGVCLRYAVLPVLGASNTQFDICVAFVDDNQTEPPANAVIGPISAADQGPGFTIPSVTNYFTFTPSPAPGKKLWSRLVKKGAPDCTAASKFLPGTTLVDPVEAVPQGYTTAIIYGNPNNLGTKLAPDTLLDQPPPQTQASIRFFNGLADGTKVAVTTTGGPHGADITVFPDTASYQFGQNPSFTMSGDFLQIDPYVANPVQFKVNGSTVGITNFTWQAAGVYSLFSFGTGGAYGGFVCEDLSTLYTKGENASCMLLHQ